MSLLEEFKEDTYRYDGIFLKDKMNHFQVRALCSIADSLVKIANPVMVVSKDIKDNIDMKERTK